MNHRILIFMCSFLCFSVSLNAALLEHIIDFSENLIINQIGDKLFPEKIFILKSAKLTIGLRFSKSLRLEDNRSKPWHLFQNIFAPFDTILLQQACKLGSLYYTSPELLFSKTLFRLCTTACGIPFEYLSKNKGQEAWKEKLFKDLTCFFQDDLIIAPFFRGYQYDNYHVNRLKVRLLNFCLYFNFLKDNSGKGENTPIEYPGFIQTLREFYLGLCVESAIFNASESKIKKIYLILIQLLLPFKGWILWYVWQKYIYTTSVSKKVRGNKFLSYVYWLFEKEQTYLKKKTHV